MLVEGDVLEAATRLLGSRPDTLDPVVGGGNSRVYRVEARGATYALKRYPEGDDRDREGAERSALRFLRANGVDTVPQWIAGEPGFALMEWVEGPVPVDASPQDVRETLAFVAATSALSDRQEARSLALASEACPSAAEVIRQVERRVDRLRPAAAAHPALAQLLETRIVPELERRERVARDAYAATGHDFAAELDRSWWRLIPADLCLHNAIRSATGLRFVDFEYFGWDDPARFAADVLLHPGSRLAGDTAPVMEAGLRAIFGRDPDFARRLEVLFPCYGLRWALILLNGFSRGVRDAHAQLSKATSMLERSRSLRDWSGAW